MSVAWNHNPHTAPHTRWIVIVPLDLSDRHPIDPDPVCVRWDGDCWVDRDGGEWEIDKWCDCAQPTRRVR